MTWSLRRSASTASADDRPPSCCDAGARRPLENSRAAACPTRRPTGRTSEPTVLIARNLNLVEGAASRSGHSGGNLRESAADKFPTSAGEHHYCELATSQILLIANILVRGDEHFEAGGFSCVEQLAVSQRVPASPATSSTTCPDSAVATPRGMPLSSRTRISARERACLDCVRQIRGRP